MTMLGRRRVRRRVQPVYGAVRQVACRRNDPALPRPPPLQVEGFLSKTKEGEAKNAAAELLRLLG